MFTAADLDRAAAIIKKGGVVAFPTETYYGLAVDPFNEEALETLFRLKRRSRSKPILVLIKDAGQLSLLTPDIPPLFQPLISRFWPGPLTLVFQALAGLSARLTGNTGTVGARISSNPTAKLLAEKTGIPITATSANISGRPPATTSAEIREQFGRHLDMVLEGGQTPGGPGSTVVGADDHGPRLIRAGVIPYQEVKAALCS